MDILCLLGNQLFEPRELPLSKDSPHWIFMREDRELCTHFAYHKQKIVFFLSAMRKYAEELRTQGFRVHYEKLGDSEEKFEIRLADFIRQKKGTQLQMFEIEDKFFESRLSSYLDQKGIQIQIHQSPMFLSSREELESLLGKGRRPFMKSFYEKQRKRLRILITPEGQPVGGQWSFDTDNRLPLPSGHQCPPLPQYTLDPLDQEVIELVNTEFPKHPGRGEGLWLPTDRKGAQAWARDFFEKRFANFGPYEDAMSSENPFVYHSVLTPYLNTGLLTPMDCVGAALKHARMKKLPLSSCEGFIRQIIGWREFIRGIYQNYSEIQETRNFFDHQKRLSPLWYQGGTEVAPLDELIGKTLRYAYAHHIERLMVAGSLMLLLEVHPQEAHRWFMEMFIDSSDWVMGPNVYGMALFSDGGLFATKPYICGSNYYRKMSDFKKGDWCEGVDGLYWSFLRKNKNNLSGNPRMTMMLRAADKISSEKMQRLEREAQKLRDRLVRP